MRTNTFYQSSVRTILRDAVMLTAVFACFFVSTAAADIQVTSSTLVEMKPATAYNSKTGEVLVVYLEKQTSLYGQPYEVRAKRFKNGVQQGNLLYPFGSASHQAIGRPAIAYSPKSNQFFVAVPEKLTSSDRVLARPLAADGSSAGPVEFLFDDGYSGYYDGNNDGHGSLHVTHNSILNQFAVTVQLTKSGNNGVWGQRVGSSGQIGSPVELSNSGLNGFNSHGIAYAPISNTNPTGGRYLFIATGTAMLLDATLQPILVTAENPAAPTVPTTSCIRLWKGEPEGNYDEFDVAYGEVQGNKRFLIVYADSDNCAPGAYPCKGTAQNQWTGIWGTYVDPEKLLYTDLYPSDIHNTPFPISKISSHFANKYAHNPRVTYSADAKAFFVVWRELPGSNITNDERYSHIRGNYVDYFVEDGLYKTSNVQKPNDNTVISDVSGGSCQTAYGLCLSTEDPDIADVAAAGGSAVMVVWQQNSFGNAGNLDIAGDLFDGPAQVDVEVNNSEGWVFIPQGKDALVSVSIQAGNRAGQNAEGWAMLLQYDFVTYSWQPYPALFLGQGPLANLPKTIIANLNWLPQGAYWLVTGFDMNVNGTPDFNSLYFDTVGLLIY